MKFHIAFIIVCIKPASLIAVAVWVAGAAWEAVARVWDATFCVVVATFSPARLLVEAELIAEAAERNKESEDFWLMIDDYFLPSIYALLRNIQPTNSIRLLATNRCQVYQRQTLLLHYNQC